jgi:FkbM family methyltransferase
MLIKRIIKRIIKKIFSVQSSNLVNIEDCNVFQELYYEEYLLNPDLLDEYLSNLYDLNSKIKFFSFRKFFKLPRVFINYMNYMKNFFPEFSINEGEIVLDIGAHHGIFTINIANMGAKVHSFEPNLMSVEIIKKNISVNSFVNDPIINNSAISDTENQYVDFDLGVRSTAGSIKNLKHKELQSGKKIKVKTVKLDNYILNNKLNQIKLLKIDCEGAEYDIFKSSREIYNIKYLIVEVHETSNDKPEDLIRVLKAKKYTVHKIKANYGAYELYCKKF